PAGLFLFVIKKFSVFRDSTGWPYLNWLPYHEEEWMSWGNGAEFLRRRKISGFTSIYIGYL
ncbi:hypothetical protein, partial [Peribacillus frigoritolerans]|uniref:hypothetical protein n=1 Tax=Peribacillus frigoritolerans TaxID=450367 RepID=UPI002282AE5D